MLDYLWTGGEFKLEWHVSSERLIRHIVFYIHDSSIFGFLEVSLSRVVILDAIG